MKDYLIFIYFTIKIQLFILILIYYKAIIIDERKGKGM